MKITIFKGEKLKGRYFKWFWRNHPPPPPSEGGGGYFEGIPPPGGGKTVIGSRNPPFFRILRGGYPLRRGCIYSGGRKGCKLLFRGGGGYPPEDFLGIFQIFKGIGGVLPFSWVKKQVGLIWKSFFVTKSALFTELKKLSVSRNGATAKLGGYFSNRLVPI